jgi:hypothetical protein
MTSRVIDGQNLFVRFFHKYRANSQKSNVTVITPTGKHAVRNRSRLLLVSIGPA